MKQTNNITLVLLTMSAVVLTALLVAGWLYNEPAEAAGPAKGGDFVMCAGAFNQESDFIYVLDIANNKLNIYYANINTNALALGDTVDLAKAFPATAGPPRR
ncbi:MAG TPA: hypothetical protein VM695_08210 [Phycisphaerae bacterium]|nr:hypothetical protein [Phycisphaerae bacterium]